MVVIGMQDLYAVIPLMFPLPVGLARQKTVATTGGTLVRSPLLLFLGRSSTLNHIIECGPVQ